MGSTDGTMDMIHNPQGGYIVVRLNILELFSCRSGRGPEMCKGMRIDGRSIVIIHTVR